MRRGLFQFLLVVLVAAGIFFCWAVLAPTDLNIPVTQKLFPLSPTKENPAAAVAPAVLPVAGFTDTARPGVIYAPVLMYHRISLVRPQRSYFVSPEIFQEQMQWLNDNGYTVVPLEQLYQALLGKIILPDKPVVLTFDDGDADQYRNAFPILQKYGYPATFFIITSRPEKKGYMTWEMIKDLAAQGMTIGSHSVNHDNLAQTALPALDYELQESKQVLESKLQQPVNFFCYPGGAFSALTIARAQAAGYLLAVTTNHRVYQHLAAAHPDALFKINRIHVDDELPTFIQWIQGKNLR